MVFFCLKQFRGLTKSVRLITASASLLTSTSEPRGITLSSLSGTSMELSSSSLCSLLSAQKWGDVVDGILEGSVSYLSSSISTSFVLSPARDEILASPNAALGSTDLEGELSKPPDDNAKEKKSTMTGVRPVWKRSGQCQCLGEWHPGSYNESQLNAKEMRLDSRRKARVVDRSFLNRELT